jgi:hypothetical protein
MWFKSKKQVILYIIEHTTIALLVVFAASAGIVFMAKQISGITKNLEQKRKLELILEKRTEITARLGQEIKTIGNTDKAIEHAYPPANNILDFVSTIESLADQNSIIQTVKFGEPVEAIDIPQDFKVAKTDYLLTMNGTVLTLRNYLRGIEAIPYMTKINSINLNAPVEKGWEGNSSITVNGALFVKPTE